MILKYLILFAAIQGLANPTSSSKGQFLDTSIQNTGGLLVLYFLFDSSGSVGKENFNTSIDFAKALVKKIGISETLNVGVVTYGKKARIDVFPLIDGSNEKLFLDKLSTIEYIGGGTATTSALEKVHRMVRGVRNILDHQSQSTRKIKSVVFLMTDGIYNSIGNPEQKAKQLIDSSIEIFVIDLVEKKKGKVQNIELLATSPKHMLKLKNDETIELLVNELLTKDFSRCGIRDHNEEIMTGKIVGGEFALFHWPWIAQIKMKTLDNSGQQNDVDLCGGSIIDNWWILTAAHCIINGVPADKLLVTVGMLNLRGADKGNRQTKEVDKIKKHEDFSNFDNDIALLKLKTPLVYGKFIRRICLPTNINEIGEESVLYKANKKVTVIGFGKTELYQNSSRLKEVEITLQSREECLHSVRNHRVIVTDRMICAGEVQGGKDSCDGDSGGPLMQKVPSDSIHQEPYWVQIGIVSWGIEGTCGIRGYPGFYSHVAVLKHWIEDTMKQN